jgi:hypothetical protein
MFRFRSKYYGLEISRAGFGTREAAKSRPFSVRVNADQLIGGCCRTIRLRRMSAASCLVGDL